MVQIQGVGRRTSPFGRELQLIFHDGVVMTFIYNRHDRHGLTADLITERFFGHVVKDTTTEFSAEPDGQL